MSTSTTVPIGWFAAEQAAHDLIVHVDGEVAVATFEYRATSDVLALTWFLSETPAHFAADSLTPIRQLHAHLSDERRWSMWCRGRLLRPPAGLAEADLRLAFHAWNRLARRGLLADFTISGVPADSPSLPACRVGVQHAWRLLHAYSEQHR